MTGLFGQVVPVESVAGLGLGATILVVLVPILLRSYAQAQAGVWLIVEAERQTSALLRAEVAERAAEADLWQQRALLAGWKPTP